MILHDGVAELIHRPTVHSSPRRYASSKNPIGANGNRRRTPIHSDTTMKESQQVLVTAGPITSPNISPSISPNIGPSVSDLELNSVLNSVIRLRRRKSVCAGASQARAISPPIDPNGSSISAPNISPDIRPFIELISRPINSPNTRMLWRMVRVWRASAACGSSG